MSFCNSKNILGMYMKWISNDLFNTSYMMPLLFAKSVTETNNSFQVAAANMNFKFSATLGPNYSDWSKSVLAPSPLNP